MGIHTQVIMRTVHVLPLIVVLAYGAPQSTNNKISNAELHDAIISFEQTTLELIDRAEAANKDLKNQVKSAKKQVQKSEKSNEALVAALEAKIIALESKLEKLETVPEQMSFDYDQLATVFNDKLNAFSLTLADEISRQVALAVNLQSSEQLSQVTNSIAQFTGDVSENVDAQLEAIKENFWMYAEEQKVEAAGRAETAASASEEFLAEVRGYENLITQAFETAKSEISSEGEALLDVFRDEFALMLEQAQTQGDSWWTDVQTQFAVKFDEASSMFSSILNGTIEQINPEAIIDEIQDAGEEVLDQLQNFVGDYITYADSLLADAQTQLSTIVDGLYEQVLADIVENQSDALE